MRSHQKFWIICDEYEFKIISWRDYDESMSYLVVLRMPVNSSPPSVSYICKWIGSTLVQLMASFLFGTKQLSKPMLVYCLLDPYEQTSMKFQSKYKASHSWKCLWKYILQKAAILSRERWVNGIALWDACAMPCAGRVKTQNRWTELGFNCHLNGMGIRIVGMRLPIVATVGIPFF